MTFVFGCSAATTRNTSMPLPLPSLRLMSSKTTWWLPGLLCRDTRQELVAIRLQAGSIGRRFSEAGDGLRIMPAHVANTLPTTSACEPAPRVRHLHAYACRIYVAPLPCKFRA